MTGFSGGRRAAPPQALDPRDFVAACYAVAVLAGGEVVHVDRQPTSFARSYHAATLRLGSATSELLGNAYHPIVAFVDPSPRGGLGAISPWHFVEPTDLAAQVRQATAFSLPPLAVLGAEPTPEDLVDLNPAERQQIRSWRPTQIGDIIFNDWD